MWHSFLPQPRWKKANKLRLFMSEGASASSLPSDLPPPELSLWDGAPKCSSAQSTHVRWPPVTHRSFPRTPPNPRAGLPPGTTESFFTKTPQKVFGSLSLTTPDMR
jgi:hypothetical protein